MVTLFLLTFVTIIDLNLLSVKCYSRQHNFHSLEPRENQLILDQILKDLRIFS